MAAQLAVLLTLGLDTLAVSLSFGLAGIQRSQRVGAALVLALYSVLMPVIGLLAAEALSDEAASLATYLAGIALICAGVYGLLALRSGALDEASLVDLVMTTDVVEAAAPEAFGLHHSSQELHMTALLGSLDKFAVGLALGAQSVRPIGTLVYLAFQTFTLGMVGMIMGKRLGAGLGHNAEVISKVLLILIGVVMVFSQILDLGLVSAE